KQRFNVGTLVTARTQTNRGSRHSQLLRLAALALVLLGVSISMPATEVSAKASEPAKPSKAAKLDKSLQKDLASGDHGGAMMVIVRVKKAALGSVAAFIEKSGGHVLDEIGKDELKVEAPVDLLTALAQLPEVKSVSS